MTDTATTKHIVLEPGKRSEQVKEFERKLRSQFVGQDEAVSQLVNVYQTILAGMVIPDRPIASLLFLGPTGSGKTKLVEATAEILLGSSKAVLKVDCGEFQHGHEIAKLVGSPPGYIGHRETQPMLTQEALNAHHTPQLKLSFLLFDEIEKAGDSLWQLLLGIMDKATVTLGDNRRVDLSRTIVVMTSNLGASEMSRLASGSIGFAPQKAEPDAFDQRIYRVAVEAAKRRFSPEFMNRIDKVVVFRTLTQEQLAAILDIELRNVQERILTPNIETFFAFHCTPEAKEFLLKEGTDPRYGARHLKRAIERYIVFPLSAQTALQHTPGISKVLVEEHWYAARVAFLGHCISRSNRNCCQEVHARWTHSFESIHAGLFACVCRRHRVECVGGIFRHSRPGCRSPRAVQAGVRPGLTVAAVYESRRY